MMKKIHDEPNLKDSLQNFSQHGEKEHHLFERPPDQEYIKAWTESLRKPSISEEKDTFSVLIFRLGQEWLALPTIFFKEVTQRKPYHRIPHRSGKILQGLVNLNGKLQLYVALNALLDIEMSIKQLPTFFYYPFNRMAAIGKEGDLWVFPVDEIDGIHHWNILELENTPVNISKSCVNYIKGIMKIENRTVGLLDGELLFSNLRGCLKRSIE